MEEEFQDKFVDEASDLVEKLEVELLELEKDAASESSINEVFRVMHTLKGAAGMFGFDMVGEVTHYMEDVYDLIREDKLKVTKEIIDLTLDTIDLLKELLETKEQLGDSQNSSYDSILKKIKSHLTDSETNEETKEEETTSKQTNKAKDSNFNLFFVHFHPEKDVFIRGVNPYSIIDEFKDLGKFFSYPEINEIPDEEVIREEDFKDSWEFYLVTEKEKSFVEDAFMFFLEDEFDILPLEFSSIDSSSDLIKIREKWSLSTPIDAIKAKIEELLPDKKEEDRNDKKSEGTDKESKAISMAKRGASSIKVPSEKLDELINLVSELVIINSQLSYIAQGEQNPVLKKAVTQVEKLSKNLRDNALELRLVPIRTLTLKFQRLVRDLAGNLGKKIDLVIEGADTELDSNIINHIESPLMHIIRNSMDHGIEDEETRISKNKPGQGIIRLIAFYSGTHVFIQVQDDGKGIDPDYIRKKAIEKGFLSQGEFPDKKDLFDLIFLPGFSTAQSISNVSGRGVGMDVVKRNITELRGEIEVDSEIDLGTSVSIKLPLTLSIIDTLQVRIGNAPYLIPLSSIESCHKKLHSELFESDNYQVEFEGELIPFIYLKEEFNISGEKARMENLIIIKQHDKRYALVVDKVLGEHQAVVKPLGHMHKDQEFLTGASILGDGSLALILDTNKLVNKVKEMAHKV